MPTICFYWMCNWAVAIEYRVYQSTSIQLQHLVVSEIKRLHVFEYDGLLVSMIWFYVWQGCKR